MKARLFVLVGSVSLSFLFLGYTTYTLQIAERDYYTKRAKAQYVSEDLLNAERGTIYLTDKNGSEVPASINKTYTNIFAVPQEIDDLQEVAHRLAFILDQDPEDLMERLSVRDQYELLFERAPASLVSTVEDAQIKGVYTQKERARYYPFESLASHVIGFVGHSDESPLPTGQYGIEAYFNETLAPSRGRVKKDGSQRVIPGKDITLTIDPVIQARAKEILADLVDRYEPVAGSIIVQDPQTGKILTMESYPAFDPNAYSESEIKTFLNPVVQGVYEPGSIVKVLTMAAGIDSGAITPDTTYYDTGSFTANGMTIRNWDLKSHGTLTMTNVIEQSINTGTVFAQQAMGDETFYQYLLDFGFKKLTGIELPGETAGKLTPLEEDIREINYATASYGQGISVTPLRMITAVSAIANGGTLHRPFLRSENQFSDSRRVMKQATADMVTEMMISAVDKNYVAKIPRFTVAGKTGTAFVPDFENGGYSDEVINTFIGFAPARNPRFTILVKIDKPKDAPLSGQTVVPAFREMTEFLLNYYQLAPDRVE